MKSFNADDYYIFEYLLAEGEFKGKEHVVKQPLLFIRKKVCELRVSDYELRTGVIEYGAIAMKH